MLTQQKSPMFTEMTEEIKETSFRNLLFNQEFTNNQKPPFPKLTELQSFTKPPEDRPLTPPSKDNQPPLLTPLLEDRLLLKPPLKDKPSPPKDKNKLLPLKDNQSKHNNKPPLTPLEDNKLSTKPSQPPPPSEGNKLSTRLNLDNKSFTNQDQLEQ